MLNQVGVRIPGLNIYEKNYLIIRYLYKMCFKFIQSCNIFKMKLFKLLKSIPK